MSKLSDQELHIVLIALMDFKYNNDYSTEARVIADNLYWKLRKEEINEKEVNI